MLNALPLDREATGRKSMDQITDLIEDGWSLVIYPEGGRSPDGWGQDFKGGPAYLSTKTGAPIVPIHAEPLPGGRCRIVIHPKLEIPPGASHRQVAQLCWDRFEPVVRHNPAPWMWMYKYWRYRPAAAERAYPDYARDSPRFDQLIAENS